MKPFVEFPEKDEFETTFSRPVFLRFKEGSPTIIRILDKSAHSVEKHWINNIKTSVICTGEQCPICKNNEKLRAEFADSFKKAKGYSARNRRYSVNVLDRTPVIRDPEDGTEYYAVKGKFPVASPDGERSLVGLTPEPSNTIKILERGKSLFEQFEALHEEFAQVGTDAEGNETITGGLTTFDIKLSTLGSGKETTITAIRLDNKDDVTPIIESKGLSPYVLSNTGILLSPSEMTRLMRGVGLKDIFAERRANDDDVTGDLKSTVTDISEEISALFGEDPE